MKLRVPPLVELSTLAHAVAKAKQISKWQATEKLRKSLIVRDAATLIENRECGTVVLAEEVPRTVKYPAPSPKNEFEVEFMGGARSQPISPADFKFQFGLEVEIEPLGSGPDLWTLENAARAIVKAQGWNHDAINSLISRMYEAVKQGSTRARNPTTGIPNEPGDPLHTYFELITTADVNSWLDSLDVNYRLGKTVPLKASQRHPTQEAAILAVIRELGLTPMALGWSDKQLVRSRLEYTQGVFDHAWKRLQAQKQIALANPRKKPTKAT